LRFLRHSFAKVGEFFCGPDYYRDALKALYRTYALSSNHQTFADAHSKSKVLTESWCVYFFNAEVTDENARRGAQKKSVNYFNTF
jgi:hypothetical protein